MKPGSPPWSAASEPIWARTSGYAWPVRCERPLAFIRACFDDSATDVGDRRLFVAGYINRVDRWASFADAWKEELAIDRPIDYLKMSEAQNLSGQFSWKNGWDEEKRDQKLRGLARVIRHFEPISFQISLSREYFYRILKPVSPRGLGSPHFNLCAGAVGAIANHAAKVKFSSPIEFIFDEQDGVEEDMHLFFPMLKSGWSRRAQNMIHGVPQFFDDKDFTPLQAADMLVWHIRREHETGTALPMADLLRADSGHIVTEIPESIMKDWAEHHAQLEGIEFLKTKSQWRYFKRIFRADVSRGANPAYIGRPNLFRRLLAAGSRRIALLHRLFSRDV